MLQVLNEPIGFIPTPPPQTITVLDLSDKFAPSQTSKANITNLNGAFLQSFRIVQITQYQQLTDILVRQILNEELFAVVLKSFVKSVSKPTININKGAN